MRIAELQSPEDIYRWMEENIQYGWIDTEGVKHISEMKNFRKMYRTMSMEEILEYKLGTCIEQVWLMHHLLDRIKTENKLFCCRIFEPDDYGNLEEEEHMHCFVLYYRDGKAFHLEHPNSEKKGIYEYASEKEAIDTIVNYYIELRGGKESPTTQFFDLPAGISFREFNAYINQCGERLGV
ncbi:MAG: transglutaminase domain-containing protein [Lachnospiraceae bacterium]|nr:transglutaminase domain-containing protein [Lachnospiraceae bacterium]MDD3795560.1 transglutaminase domain-containing protein [Lachnospiraceae bacterium]